jgi:hypothetical protein
MPSGFFRSIRRWDTFPRADATSPHVRRGVEWRGLDPPPSDRDHAVGRLCLQVHASTDARNVTELCGFGAIGAEFSTDR